MAVIVTHAKIATLPDEPGAEVNKFEWNENHVIAGLGTAAESAATDFALAAHAIAHQNGGADEISVAGLSGLLADAQTALAHAASHQNGGADEVSVAGLSGLLADEQTPLSHDILTKHSGFPGGGTTFLRDDGTFAVPPGGAPSAHATSHQNGGSDEISVAGLSGVLADPQTPAAHAAAHQNGGADEISVAGLSGLLADGQDAKAIITTTGPTTLDVGAVADGEFLRRVGATVVGASPGAGSTDIKATTVTVTSPALEASFTVTDAGVSAGSQIIVGWGNCAQSDANHPGMGQVGFNAIPGTGEFTVELYSLDQSKLFGAFNLNYLSG